MLKRNEILFKYLIIILAWIFLGYFFYCVLFYTITKCTQIFNSELLFGVSITLGALNGISSSSILEFLAIRSKKINKNLIQLFFILHIIVIFISFILNLNWLIYMFSLFSFFGFIYMYLEFNQKN